MVRQGHFRWIVVAVGAVGLAVLAASAPAASGHRSALDERPGRGPQTDVETLVLRFIHIPAESFVETLEQLADRSDLLREGFEQMPVAVNEPANAVVIMAPPEVAAVLARVADELDQPNEFLLHERERKMQELQFTVEVERHERDFERDQDEFDLEMDRRRLELDRGPQPPRPMDRGGPPRMMPRGPQPPRPMGRPERPPDREAAEHRHGEIRELDAQQHALHAAMEDHRRHAEAQREELQRQRERILQQHRRRVEQAEGKMRPEQREAMQRHLHEQMEAMETHGRRLQEDAERKQHEIRERIEQLEHRKHDVLQGSREPPERRHEEPRPDGPPRRDRPDDRRPAQAEPLGALLSPDARRQLGLSDDQIEAIRNLANRVRTLTGESLGKIRQRLREVGPDERERLLRGGRERFDRERADVREGVKRRLAEILHPEQREKLRRWFGERGPKDRPGEGRRDEPRRDPDRDREHEHDRDRDRDRDPHRPHHPAVGEGAVQHLFV